MSENILVRGHQSRGSFGSTVMSLIIRMTLIFLIWTSLALCQESYVPMLVGTDL